MGWFLFEEETSVQQDSIPTLVLGSDGYIGQALVNSLVNALGTSRRPRASVYLDLAEPTSWQALSPYAGARLVFCAATTKMADYQANPEAAYQLNVRRTCELLDYTEQLGMQVVYLSSNMVFAGQRPDYRVTDACQPANYYGECKYQVEQHLLNHHTQAAILRLTKVLGERFPVLQQCVESARRQESCRLFSDLYMAPVSLSSVQSCVAALLAQQARGIFQLSGSRNLSYAEAGQWLLQQLGLDPAWIEPIAAASAGVSVLPFSSMINHWPQGWSAAVEPECVLAPLLAQMQGNSE